MIKKLAAFYAKLSKRERTMFFGAAGALGLFFINTFVVTPAIEKMLSIEREIRSEEIAIQKSMHILLRKEQITAEGKQFEYFSVVGKTQEEEMTSLLKDIEAIADKSSVSLLYVRPGTIKEEAGVKKYYASLECEADMQDVANFFHSIENSTKLLQVDKYEIQPKSKESTVTRATVTISKTVLAA